MPNKAAEEASLSGAVELRSTMHFGREEPPRETMQFGKGAGPRSTMQFGKEAPSNPALPPMTLQFESEPGSFTPLESEPADAHRSTQVFSESTAGPLEPHEMPDVRPLVIRLDLDESIPEPRSIVDSLKDEVDAVAKPAARAVLLTGTIFESSGSRSSPSLPTAWTTPEPRAPFSSPPTPIPPGSSPPSPLPLMSPPAMGPPSPIAPRMLSRSPLPVASSVPEASAQMPSLASLRAGAAGSNDAWSWSANTTTRAAPTEGLPPAPTPRPSPALAPQASSAWDVRGSPGIRIDDMVGPDRTLELVGAMARAAKSPDSVRVEVSSLLAGARDLIDLDDHTGAMQLIAKAQALAPDDPEVQALREKSERTLLAMFESKLGGRDVIPRVMLKDDEIIWLNLDHRAGFVLAQIDGSVTFDDLFAVSGMSRLDTARILAQLVDEGVISGR